MNDAVLVANAALLFTMGALAGRLAWGARDRRERAGWWLLTVAVTYSGFRRGALALLPTENQPPLNENLIPFVTSTVAVITLLILGDSILRYRAAAAERAAAEQRFFRAIDLSSEPMGIVDGAGTYRYVNEASSALFQYRREEVVGQHYAKFLVEAGPRGAAFDSTRDSGAARTGVVRHIRVGGGGIVSVETEMIPLGDGNTLFIAHDLTAVLEADALAQVRQEALEQSERAARRDRGSLQEAQRISHLGSWEYNAETQRIECSDEMLRIHEIDPAHYDGNRDTLVARVHPDDLLAVERAAAQSQMTGIASVTRHRLLMPDGRIKWVDNRYTVDRSPLDGRSITRGTIQDVTEAHLAAAATRERDELLSAMLAALPMSLMAMDRNGIIQRLEGSLLERLNGNHGDPLGQSAPAYVPDQPARTEAIRRALAGERTHAEFDYFGVWVDATYVPTFDAEGHVDGVVGIAFDISDRRRLTQLAEENRRHLRTIIDSSHDWIFTKDLEHRYTLVNRAFAAAHGFQPEEMVGHLDTEFFPYEEVLGSPTGETPGFHDDDDAVAHGRSIRNFGQRAVLPTGDLVLDEFKEPIRNAGGAVTGIVGYVRDVTEREAALDALRTTAARLVEAQTLARIGSWEMNFTTNQLDWTPEMYRIFEIDPGAGSPSFGAVLERTHPDDLDAVTAARATSLEQHQPYRVTHRILLPDGRVKWIEELADFDARADGAPTIVRGTVQDVSDAVTLRETAQRTGEQLARIVDAAPLPIVMLDEGGTIMAANPATDRVFGWAPGELRGQDAAVLSFDLEGAEGGGVLQQFVQTNRPLSASGLATRGGREIRGVRKDGTEFPAELTVAEIPLPDGTRQYVGIAVDRTEARAKEEQLIRMQKLDAVGTLVAGVAHDFNNLLTAIIGGIELSMTEPGNARWPEMAKASAEEAAGLVRQLLRFSREEAPTRAAVSPVDLISSVMAIASATMDRRITITAQDSSWLPDVMADRSQIEQVLLNLVVNARDAVMERAEQGDASYRPTVTILGGVATHQGTTGVTFTVRDNGVGIPADVRQRMFDPFFTTKPVGRGTGLGLSIVNGIIEGHGGTVEITSEVGSGTSITCWLPRAGWLGQPADPAAGNASVRAGASITEQPTTATRGRILVVDDEVAIGEVARAYLEASGYDVSLYQAGAQAIDAAEREHFDLAVVDLNMPAPDGWAVLAALKAGDPALPVVIASGFAAEADVLAQGACGLLFKPYGRDQLLEAAERRARRAGGPAPAANLA